MLKETSLVDAFVDYKSWEVDNYILNGECSLPIIHYNLFIYLILNYNLKKYVINALKINYEYI
jgi:hypothetical protein